MAITDSQLVGLSQLFLAQQKDIIELKARNLSLHRALVGICGEPIVEPLKAEYEQALQQASADGSLQAIAAIESVISELLPTTGSKN